MSSLSGVLAGRQAACRRAGRANGVRVFDAADGYRPLPSDSDYGNDSYWVDFDQLIACLGEL